MLFAADFRQIARNALKGRWVLAVLTGVVACLLGGSDFSGNNGPQVTIHLNDGSLTGWQQSGYSFGGFGHMISDFFGLLTIVMLILFLVVGGVVALGYAKFNLHLVDGEAASFGDLFSQFDRFGAALWLRIRQTLVIFLWTLLLIIPGILAVYDYAVSEYVMAENPGITAAEAMRLSKEMMYGNRFRLFCLELSFLGWMILGALAFGVGVYVVYAYREAARAAFFREISGSWKQGSRA